MKRRFESATRTRWRRESPTERGRRFRKAVALDIVRAIGVPHEAVRVVRDSENGPHVRVSGGAFPFAVTTAYREAVKLWEQLDNVAGWGAWEGLPPVFVFRRHHSRTWACLEWERLLALIAKARSDGKDGL